jgi:hypothetical protein
MTDLTAGQDVSWKFGKAQADRDEADIYWDHIADGSFQNALAFRFNGVPTPWIYGQARNFVGINTVSPTSRLNVAGGSITVTGAGASLYVGTMVVVVPNGKVGIGVGTTTLPTSMLDVSGGSITIRGANSGLIISSGTAKNSITLGSVRNARDAYIEFAAGTTSADRIWNIGMPFHPTLSNTTFYSFVIDDPAVGTIPELMVKWGTGNVGIGTNDPNATLHVVGQSTFTQTAYFTNTGGVNAIQATGKVLAVGPNSELSTLDRTTLDQYTFYGTADIMRIYRGDVGDVASWSNAGNMTIIGCLNYNGGSLGSCLSDESLKENIEPITGTLEKISALRPVTFFWKDKESPEKMGMGNRKQYGLIAQDVERVMPWMVNTSSMTGLKQVNYGTALDMHMIQAIKELNAKVDEQAIVITDLRQRIEALEVK